LKVGDENKENKMIRFRKNSKKLKSQSDLLELYFNWHVFIRNVLNPDISAIDISTMRYTAKYQWKLTAQNYFSLI
jgi:hypothetical protein